MAEPTERIAILLELQQQEFEKRAKSAGASIDRLERKFNPLAAAEERMKRKQDQLNAALEAGTLTAARHAKGMDLVQREYDQTIAKTKKVRDNVVAMNSAVAAQTGFMARNRNMFQQAGYQVGDFAVQVQGGTSAITAFTQQGSQMLGVFGAWGAIAGAVLAVGAPLIASFMQSGEEAGEFKDRAEALTAAVQAYSEAAANARIPTDELREKYGSAATAAGVFHQALMDLNKAIALESLSGAQLLDAIDVDRMRVLLDYLASVPEDSRAFSTKYASVLAELQETFGTTEAQARMLLEAIDAFGAAQGPSQVVAEGENLLAVITDIFGPLDELSGGMLELARQTQAASEEAALLQGEIENNTLTMQDFVDAAYAAGDAIASALPSADAMLGRLKSLAAAAWEYAGALGASGTQGGRGGDPRTMGGSLRDWNNPENRPIVNPGRTPRISTSGGRSRRSGGGRSRSGGGGGRGGREQEPLFSIAEEELQKLQRTMDMLGKSKEEVAALTVKHKLLDEAKKRGLDITDELLQKIDAEAANVGKLAGEYENARDKMAQMEKIQGEWKDSIVDAAMGGADAMDAFTNSLKRAALEYLLFGEGMFAGGGKSSGGGLLGSIFSGFFDKGGRIPSGKFGIAGENGPEIITGPAQVTSTRDTARAMQGAAGGGQVDVRVYVDQDGNWQSAVERISGNVSAKVTETKLAANNRAQADNKYLSGGR
ncbi:hypothetical protein A3734_16735 [Sulfitobacter sp. HI0054]|uniref:hypothetical protein n=1 Tax=Sulfitobacter sp. HI0054 TaxID=1822238 RepID=UPI0007C270EE|nr:hypothetical protein [Sulfitobacter sp. HI0054]KZY53122.1 hypothetical protein A3734_16735 [Sulfitobacter sp. HI0054]